MSFEWTDERVEQVKRLWADGLSAGQIAIKFGISRNSAIGKVHRLGLTRRVKGVQPDPAKQRQRKNELARQHRQERAGKLAGGGFMFRHLLPIKPGKLTQQASPEAGGPILESRPCSLLELTDKRCKWPIGHPREPEFHFCGGKAIEGRPYCGCHERMAYASARAA